MNKKLSPRFRNWIYYNIKRFHAEDLYLRHLNTKILLSEFKSKLNDSEYIENLDASLQEESYLTPFRFYRKDGNYFLYPSFRDQVMSLIECWNEISTVYKKIYNGSEDQYQTPEAEPFFDSSKRKKTKITRTTFGNKANISSSPRITHYESIHQHIMTANRSIKCSFQFEYNAFKSRCLDELKNIETRTKSKSYFVQTDLKSFFHRLQIDTIKRIINVYELKKSKSWLDKISETFPEQGLPIGWILSGFFADLTLIEFSAFIDKNQQQILKQLNITSFSMINYVDDMVFFIKSKDEQTREKFLNSFCTSIQESIRIFFEGSDINIHPPSSPKTKFVELSKASASLLRSNWHDIDLLASGPESESNQHWTALDDFLLQSDNDLMMNEKVQFFHNLKILRQRIENDEITTITGFKPYKDKILYKLSVDKKYLPTIFDTLLLFVGKDNVAGDVKSIINEIWDFLTDIEDINALDFIHFLKCLQKHIAKDLKGLKDYEDFSRKTLKFFSTRKSFKDTHDLDLISSFFTNFYLNYPSRDTTLCKDAQEEDLYFHKLSCTALTYNSILNKETSIQIKGNVFIAFEIIKRSFDRKKTDAKDFTNELNTFIKNIRDLQTKKSFVQNFFRNFSYYFLPLFDKEGLANILDFFAPYTTDESVFEEIEILYREYDSLNRLFSSSLAIPFNDYTLSLNLSHPHYHFKKPSCFPFKVLSTTKQYLYFKEILTSLLFSCATYRNAATIILFQYRPTDSFVFFSWQCLPLFYGSTSHLALGVTKELLSFKTINIQLKKQNIFSNFDPSKYTCLPSLSSDSRLSFINLEIFETFLTAMGSTFIKPEIKLMVANLYINTDKGGDLDPKNNFRLKDSSRKRIHKEVMKALKAAEKASCDVICFPELTLPQNHLDIYLDYAGERNIILIAGVEYFDLATNIVANPTIISIPTDKNLNPTYKNHHAYVQFKNHLSIKEIFYFERLKPKVFMAESNEILVFISKKVHNFSVLTCSDFLSLEIKYLLQGLVQTLFVPAMNFDNTTYHHVAQSAIREIYCICVVCNNSYMGASHVFAPFRKDWKRTLFRIEGISEPKTHHLTIDPSVIKDLQVIGESKNKMFEECDDKIPSDITLKLDDFKQVPPDWAGVRAKKKNAI